MRCHRVHITLAVEHYKSSSGAHPGLRDIQGSFQIWLRPVKLTSNDCDDVYPGIRLIANGRL